MGISLITSAQSPILFLLISPERAMCPDVTDWDMFNEVNGK